MELIKDYAGFAARFMGFAYVVVYALTAPELGAAAAGLLPVVPPGLHLMGALAAGFVAVEGMLSTVRAARRKPQPGASPALLHKSPPLRQRAPAPKPVKRRDHFGLRGTPR